MYNLTVFHFAPKINMILFGASRNDILKTINFQTSDVFYFNLKNINNQI